ncbi:MAG TPA: hypothetical protein VFJ16_01985 [Longimicrobium sp.]|nr:hypothetical protein [Longimicrobium sp.]
MTDFLARLAARVLNTAPVVEPVLTSRYAPGDEGPSSPIGSWREHEAAPAPLGLEEITREVEPTPPGVLAPREAAFERSPGDAAPTRRRPAPKPAAAADDAGPSDDEGLLVPPPARRAHVRPRPVETEPIIEEDHFSAPSTPRHHRPATASDASARSAESGEGIESTESMEPVRPAAAASSRPARRSPVAAEDEAVLEVHEEVVSSPRVTRPRPSAPRADATIDGRLTNPEAADRPLPAEISAHIAARRGAAEDDRALLVPTHKPRARVQGDAEGREDAGPAAAPRPARGRRAGRDEERGMDDAAPPTIKVSVGRVEIRALEPPARKRRPERGGEKAGAGWSAPVLSLDTYLRGGAGR